MLREPLCTRTLIALRRALKGYSSLFMKPPVKKYIYAYIYICIYIHMTQAVYKTSEIRIT